MVCFLESGQLESVLPDFSFLSMIFFSLHIIRVYHCPQQYNIMPGITVVECTEQNRNV